jgi:SPP1 gp7 family putative phage head morphogenesis protein
MPTLNDKEMLFALNLPPEKVMAYMKQKGYTYSFKWKEVWQGAHNKAFTVAKAMNLDVLEAIRGEVQKAIDTGTTLKQFQKDLKPTLNKLGWWGRKEMIDPTTGEIKEVQLGSPARLKTIYQTNLNVAYSVGRYQEQMEVAKDRPYWQYSSMKDPSTRPTHRAMNGKVFRFDDPIWNKIYPPNDWGCRCRVNNLTEADMKERGLTPEISDNSTIPKGFQPPEWAYNPGKNKLFDKNGGLPECFGVTEYAENGNAKCIKGAEGQKSYEDYGRPTIKNVEEKYFLEAPEMIKKANSIQEAEQILLDTFGLTNENKIITVKSPVEDITVNKDYLEHIILKRDNARERFANYILPTLENPYEIWATKYQDGGIRKQYVGLFKGKYNLLCVVRMNEDGSLLWNMMNGDNRDLNKNRKGLLIYCK